QGATSTTPSTTAVPETRATSTEPSPAESAPATPGSQSETASELTLSMPSAPTTAPAGQRFTEYLVQIPDPDRYPQRASGVVSVWSSGTIPAGTLFELYRSGERYFYRR